MKKSKALAIALLFAFVSFVLDPFPHGNEKPLSIHGSKAADEGGGFHLKDEDKKHSLKLTAGIDPLVLPLGFLLYSALNLVFHRKAFFFTPIFYQSNYIDQTP